MAFFENVKKNFGFGCMRLPEKNQYSRPFLVFEREKTL